VSVVCFVFIDLIKDHDIGENVARIVKYLRNNLFKKIEFQIHKIYKQKMETKIKIKSKKYKIGKNKE
jgi:hypothetical protein